MLNTKHKNHEALNMDFVKLAKESGKKVIQSVASTQQTDNKEKKGIPFCFTYK